MIENRGGSRKRRDEASWVKNIKKIKNSVEVHSLPFIACTHVNTHRCFAGLLTNADIEGMIMSRI